MIENAQLNLTGVNQSAWSLARWSGGPALRRRCRHHARRLQVLLQQFLVRNRQVEGVAVAGETLKLSPRLHWLGSNLLKKSCSQVSFDRGIDSLLTDCPYINDIFHRISHRWPHFGISSGTISSLSLYFVTFLPLLFHSLFSPSHQVFIYHITHIDGCCTE